MTMHKRLPTTEKRNPRSENIDERSTLDIVELLRPAIAESTERV